MSEHRASAEIREEIIGQVDAIIRSCEENRRPLEMDPARSELFELFVQAERAGCVREDGPCDLTADGLCQTLATQWGLKGAAQASVTEQAPIPAEHLARMRSLWSVMRMWMEWTYAWERWPEFHSRP